MKCDRCGFDMGDALSDSGRCVGCGIPLGPSKDAEAPPPGFPIPADGEDYVVTEEDRREHPDKLEHTLVIRQLEYEWGDGIGASPHGYFTRDYEAVVEREDDEDCPECGAHKRVYEFGQDRAGVAWFRRETCLVCGYEHREEHGA